MTIRLCPVTFLLAAAACTPLNITPQDGGPGGDGSFFETGPRPAPDAPLPPADTLLDGPGSAEAGDGGAADGTADATAAGGGGSPAPGGAPPPARP